MNERDSEAVRALLQSSGLKEAEKIEDTGIVILNTCTVRDSADRKVEGYLWQLREWKNSSPGRILGIMGCMAQDRKDSLLEKFPHLDFVLGTGQTASIPKIISTIINSPASRISETEILDLYDDFQTHLPKNQVSAFVSVIKGCSMFCSYCIVPYVRGAEKSRSENEIIREVEFLCSKGVKEIFLLGQNIAAYGLNKKAEKQEKISPLAELIRKISSIDEVKRIRFTSPHPASFNDSLIAEICENRKVCDKIHIPLQSGSDEILKAMNRNYSASDYMRMIEKLRKGRPKLSFSTDIIVGFPGETDSDFEMTRKLMNDIAFDQAFIFKYSKRRNTPASEMNEQVPQKIKEERNKILLDDLKIRVEKNNNDLIGKALEVLVERESPKRNDRLIGKTSSNKTVVLWKKEGIKIGDIVDVLIEDSTPAALYGSVHP
jgi:tRNA-2-methylthio-N6-dimethylallyladenosine synthase